MRLRAVRSGADLARRCGQNVVTVRSHLNGTRTISRKAADCYSRALRLEPAWLLYGVGGEFDATEAMPRDRQLVEPPFLSTFDSTGPTSEERAPVENLRQSNIAVPDIRALGRDMPVLGTAECGADGAFRLNLGDPIDFVRRPPGIASRKGVYCIYAEGASMEPVYEAGDLVFADPHRPPRPGRDVVIQLRPKPGEAEPRCFLKRLVRRQGSKWIFRQFNPAQEMGCPDRDVMAVHLVLKSHELLGI